MADVCFSKSEVVISLPSIEIAKYSVTRSTARPLARPPRSSAISVAIRAVAGPSDQLDSRRFVTRKSRRRDYTSPPTPLWARLRVNSAAVSSRVGGRRFTARPDTVAYDHKSRLREIYTRCCVDFRGVRIP